MVQFSVVGCISPADRKKIWYSFHRDFDGGIGLQASGKIALGSHAAKFRGKGNP